jgi:hypothetical protein
MLGLSLRGLPDGKEVEQNEHEQDHEGAFLRDLPQRQDSLRRGRPDALRALSQVNGKASIRPRNGFIDAGFIMACWLLTAAWIHRMLVYSKMSVNEQL